MMPATLPTWAPALQNKFGPDMTASSLFRRFLLIALLALTASACVYRIDIQQGNFLENKDIDQISVGMTRSQVRYLLGTPIVGNAFQDSRWDYVYYLKQGRSRKTEQRHFTVYFEEDKVTRIDRPDVPKA